LTPDDDRDYFLDRCSCTLLAPATDASTVDGAGASISFSAGVLRSSPHQLFGLSNIGLRKIFLICCRSDCWRDASIPYSGLKRRAGK
jgi:hypothetical protein